MRWERIQPQDEFSTQSEADLLHRPLVLHHRSSQKLQLQRIPNPIRWTTFRYWSLIYEESQHVLWQEKKTMELMEKAI